jgi:hypothetical protein
MTAGCQRTCPFFDDIIVGGTDEEDHWKNLEAVMQRIVEWGFHLSAEKCHINQRSTKFLGFILDENGRHPDPEKIAAIKKMPPPKNITQLRAFMGMINFYGKFIHRLHSYSGPLYELMKKNVRYEWKDKQKHAFEELRGLLTSDMVLTHYDPSKPIIVAADASEYGIGGVIMHEFPDGSQKPIAFTSRAFNDAEKNYGQIEKEALGLITAVKKFHQYIYGRSFLLLTDHKPLTFIFKPHGGIPKTTASRLKRWARTLLDYTFTIKYVNTKEFGEADALSRLIAETSLENEDEMVIAAITCDKEIDSELQLLCSKLPVKNDDIVAETMNDDKLQRVIKCHSSGKWIKDMDSYFEAFYRRRDSLSFINGSLMMEDRVVIPSSLQHRVLKMLHQGHPGIVRMKSLARSIVYWPNIDKEIENLVKSCHNCQVAAKMPPKEKPIPWSKPSKPWSRVHIDYAGPVQNLYFLVVVDAYSKWPEIVPTKTISAKATVDILRQILGRYGMPEEVISDNGTQFTSRLFKEFCDMNGIIHHFSPVYHPQSNGQAERFVDSFKRALLKLDQMVI